MQMPLTSPCSLVLFSFPGIKPENPSLLLCREDRPAFCCRGVEQFGTTDLDWRDDSLEWWLWLATYRCHNIYWSDLTSSWVIFRGYLIVWGYCGVDARIGSRNRPAMFACLGWFAKVGTATAGGWHTGLQNHRCALVAQCLMPNRVQG